MHGFAHNINILSVYRACVAWEKKRGIYKDSKSFGRDGYAAHMAEKKLKALQGQTEQKVVRERKTPEQLREADRIRTARYRARHAEMVKERNREYAATARAKKKMSDEERNEKQRIRVAAYRANNKEKLRELKRGYQQTYRAKKIKDKGLNTEILKKYDQRTN
jgi:hypothetical protein